MTEGKRIRSSDVMVQGQRLKRGARASSASGRPVHGTPKADALIEAVNADLPDAVSEIGSGGELIPVENTALASAFRDPAKSPGEGWES